MIGFEEAAARVLALAAPLDSETVGLDEAFDRVLARPLAAAVDAPAAPTSAMDGYAVREADLAGAPVTLPVCDVIFAGRADPSPLPPGQCARIFTGAPLPPGADRVVMQENVVEEDGRARFAQAPAGGRHVRARGSDFKGGETLLAAGTGLTAQRLVAAASADVATVSVVRRPKVLVLATGDELAEPGTSRTRPGTIPESVSFGVLGLARQWGAEVLGRRRLADAPEDLEQAAALALTGADIVVVTGGASVGEKDHARAMFESSGLEFVFSKVAIKPGKPVWIGRAGGRIVVGLPGNPTSALVTARLFLAPLVAGLAGRDPAGALAWETAVLTESLPPTGDRETFMRGRRTAGGVGLVSSQDSGAQKALAECDVLIRRTAGAPAVDSGDAVDVLPF